MRANKIVRTIIKAIKDTFYKLVLSQQIQIYHDKYKFTTENSNTPRQVQIRHGKFTFTAADPDSSQQIQIYHSKFKFSAAFQIHHGKFKLTVAISNSPRQIQSHCRRIHIHHGKFKFATANSSLLHQIQIHQGKFKFAVANSNSLRQIQIHHGKFKFTWQNHIHCGNVPTHVVTLTQVGTSVYLGQTHLGTPIQVPAWIRKLSLGSTGDEICSLIIIQSLFVQHKFEY